MSTSTCMQKRSIYCSVAPRPFLDATGALTGTVSASLDEGEVVERQAWVRWRDLAPCQAAPRGAQFINLEKEIGAFNVRPRSIYLYYPYTVYWSTSKWVG